jgi:molybdate transport system substrate-binding protein
MGPHREDLGGEAGPMSAARPPLNLLSAGAAEGLAGTLARSLGLELAGHFGAVGAMRERFVAREPCDLVILTHAQIAELTAQGLVVPGTSAELGTVRTSVAVRAGAALPDVSSGEALRAALRAVDAIYFPDPQRATAGIHFIKVLDALGVRAELEPRLRPQPNGMSAMRELAAAPGRPIGCTQATEILATAGVALVAPLPPEHELATVYVAALAAHATQALQASGFAAQLTGDASRVTRQAAGCEGSTIRPAGPGDAGLASDAAAVRAVVRTVLSEMGLRRDADAADDDLKDLAASYLQRGGSFDVVVDAAGSIVGCCGVYPGEGRDPHVCELRKMYLLPAARGQGLGRRLLERALAFARGRGYRRMELETASALKTAIALYRSAGFQPLQRTVAGSRCDQVMALDLRR